VPVLEVWRESSRLDAPSDIDTKDDLRCSSWRVEKRLRCHGTFGQTWFVSQSAIALLTVTLP
jgi:hypothetical protein